MRTTPSSAPGSAPLPGQAATAPLTSPGPPAGLGLSWRALGPADLPAVAALFVRTEGFDDVPIRTTQDEAREFLEGTNREPERNSLGGFDADGELRAQGFVRLSLNDSRVVRAFLDGGVDPSWRGRGVGRALLTWQVARARDVLGSARGTLPAAVATYVEEGVTDKAALLTAAGFVARRFYTDMRRDLSVPIPEVSLREGLTLVPWTPERDDAVRQAHNEAFAEDWGATPHTPESWAEDRSSFAPEWSFVVLDRSNDRSPVAGYLLSERYEQDWPMLGYSEGYIDVLGVRRQWRGKRVATVLLTAAMRAYAADGIQYAGLGVDTDNPTGAAGIFAALGFEPTRGSALFCLDL